jgi:8-oxo-dGTP diphosphatase
MTINFHHISTIADQYLIYAVVAAEYNGLSAFVRHHDRFTWEIPGGRREAGETIAETAHREMMEETGACDFSLHPVCDYSFNHEGETTYGRLFFGQIALMGPLPQMEIAEVKLFNEEPGHWTYPLIQPLLHKKISQWKTHEAFADQSDVKPHNSPGL